ncbi:phosphate ABC transporter permease subunit PstC [Candidatus Heimdallarchaeota archaeon]|nr:MAG: phosphate ABC transporter permease subunit PstC [Candidatus Gerdarchaeota archaeon]RLI74293.1 MAG: phosphate ABC transporter permease subunit PstC [Candidatus Heimdallarchaeota archaeon]
MSATKKELDEAKMSEQQQTSDDLASDEETIIAIGKQKISFQHVVLLLAASLSVIIVVLVFIFTVLEGYRIIPEYGFIDFLFGHEWDSPHEQYGILPMIVGTILVVLIAAVIAIPVGTMAAMYLSEIAPEIVRKIMKPIIEILASIPSIIYGFIGWRTLVLFLQNQLGFKSGRTAFTAGVVLSIMILPTIITIADDSLKAVPRAYREGSFALGATNWQTIRKVVLPASSSGLTAAYILGFGRAIGETMAVYFLAGGGKNLQWNIFRGVDTLTSLILKQLPEASIGSVEYHAIFGAACVLFLITFCVNLIGDLLIRRFSKKFRGASK